MPRWSVIIPAYNEAARIDRCLAAVKKAAAQAAEDPEILVMDNASTDDTVARAKAAGARVEGMNRVSIAELRNRGAALAKGEILIFLDGDMEPSDDWFETLHAWFAPTAETEKPPVDALGFRIDVPPEAPWVAHAWVDRHLGLPGGAHPTDFLHGRCLVVRRKAFENIGGFDATLTTSEDKDFTLRLVAANGLVMALSEPVLIHHGYETSFIDWAKKEFWRQGSHLAVLQKHGNTRRLLRMPLISLVHLIWGVVVLLALLSGSLEVVLLAALWVLPAAVQAAMVRLEPDPWKRRAQIAFLYWARYLITAVALFAEALRDRPKAKKQTAKES